MLRDSRTSDSDESHTWMSWDFYEFFRAPGIFYHPDGEKGRTYQYGSGPSMMPKKYGYRLGTKEEVDVFKRLRGDKE